MKDFRENWLLSQGDTMEAGEYVYTITGAPLGYGGSAVLYPAKRTDSELSFAVKECFPNSPGRFERKSGIISVISEDDREGKELLTSFRKMFEKERRAGQSIRNATGRSIGMWENLHVKTVTTGGQTYDATEGIYALLERMDGKGCSLSDILKDCREEVSSLYPLRTGGLPDIYTTACIMEQVLQALQGVHKSGYLFGDIQVNNVFFMDCRLGEGYVGFGCLFDFGCARALLEDGYTEEITDCKIFSTEGYIPPEVLHHNNGHLRLGKQADVYSAGKLMLLCLLTEGQDLTESSMSIRRLLQAYHGKRIKCGETALELVNRILEKSLQPEPKKRYMDAGAMLEDIKSLKKLTEPPKYRLDTNMSSPDYFVPSSREKEIKALKESIQQGEHPMLWGYGGMGKTETAIELARRMDTGKGAYLVRFQNSIRETILSLHFSRYRYQPTKGLSLEEQQEQEYRERMELLKDYYEESILIIDNFDNEQKTLDELRREKEFGDLVGLNLHLIFTTRYPVGRKDWEIAELDRKELLSIMKFYLKSVPMPSDEKLFELIEAAGSHTLTVSLMAKTLEESWGMVTPDTILEAFKNSSVSEEAFPEVVSDQNRTYRQDHIYRHLKVLFNISHMSENEKKVLAYAVLLPQGGMDVGLFMDCLEKEEQKCLQKLVAKGWLRRQEGNLLTIHPIICQVCREELKTDVEMCQGFLENLWDRFDKYDFNFVCYSQMAESFSKAAEHLDDEEGEYSAFAGFLYSDIREDQKGLDFLKEALRIKEAILPPNHEDLAFLYNNLGGVYQNLGDYARTLEYSRKALEIREEILQPNHPDLATSHNNVGGAYSKLGEYEKSLEHYLKALDIRKEIFPINHLDLATSYNNIGSIYADFGEYEKSLKYIKKALEIQEEILLSNHPDLAISYSNIGTVYGDLGEYEKSLEYCQKALEIQKEILPSNHPDLAHSYNNLGGAYSSLDDYEKALKYMQKALEIMEEILPSKHPNLGHLYNNIGSTYIELEDYEKALKYCHKALEIMEEILPSKHPDLGHLYNNIGSTYIELEDYEKALKYCHKALEIMEEILPSKHPDLTFLYDNIDCAYVQLGDYEKSLEYFHKSLEIKEDILPTNHPYLADLYDYIRTVYEELGEYDKSMKYFEKAQRILEES